MNGTEIPDEEEKINTVGDAVKYINSLENKNLHLESSTRWLRFFKNQTKNKHMGGSNVTNPKNRNG